jgi:hypothetical protein
MRYTLRSFSWIAWASLACAATAAEPAGSYYAPGGSVIRISDETEAAGPYDALPAAAYFAPAEQPASYAAATGHSGYCADCNRKSYTDGACGCSPTNWAGACGYGCDCHCNAVRVEYLLWFSRGRNVPPLVTTSLAGTPAGDAGVLGLATTSVLYGNDPIGTDIRNGGRITVSHLFRDEITWGDVRFWGVEDSSETFFITGNQAPILAVPFYNILLDQEDALLLEYPGIAGSGSTRVLSKNDLIGGDAWLRRNWWSDCCGKLDILAGYQFTRLDDSITMLSSTTSLAGVGAGTQFDILDQFRTQNEFHGASVGFLAEARRGVLTLEVLGKIAVGNMRQQVTIDGSTVSTSGGGSSVAPGGLFAEPTNMGTYERNRIAFSPELNVNLIYNINPNWRLIGGYSFIYWSNVVLAGNQIDRVVNTSQFAGGNLTGPARPAFSFARTDFWVQGMNFGAEYRW